MNDVKRLAGAADSEGRTLHNRLPTVRADRGLSRQELADAVGVNYQTVGYLERGEYNPSLELAFRSGEYFGMPIEAIFGRKPFQPLSDSVYRPNGDHYSAGSDGPAGRLGGEPVVTGLIGRGTGSGASGGGRDGRRWRRQVVIGLDGGYAALTGVTLRGGGAEDGWRVPVTALLGGMWILALVRLVRSAHTPANGPDERLDERQQAVRDRA